MLIKPQELNQARLYAVETRIKENEGAKIRDFDFVKETMKKLIYAIEQAQISSVQKPMPRQSEVVRSQTKEEEGPLQSVKGQQLPTLIKAKHQTQSGHQRTISLSSQGGGFFGQGSTTGNEMGGQVATLSEDKQKAQAPSSQATTKLPGTSEILFLKRLLYLKASIDNETTLNAMSVPFEQEKLRDMSSPDQVMFSSDGVLSSQARNSAATYHSNVVLGEQKLAIAPEPPRTAAGGPRPRRHGLDMMSNFVTNDQISNYKIPANDHIDLSILDNRKLSTRGQTQKRRNVMTKSMNPGNERRMQVRTLEDNIEAGKYLTEKDI